MNGSFCYCLHFSTVECLLSVIIYVRRTSAFMPITINFIWILGTRYFAAPREDSFASGKVATMLLLVSTSGSSSGLSLAPKSRSDPRKNSGGSSTLLKLISRVPLRKSTGNYHGTVKMLNWRRGRNRTVFFARDRMHKNLIAWNSMAKKWRSTRTHPVAFSRPTFDPARKPTRIATIFCCVVFVKVRPHHIFTTSR